MTMLDSMRRHKNILKWTLALVCLAFIIFYIPAFLNPGTGAANYDTVATVNGQPISANEFRRVYQAQVASYRRAYGGSLSDQMLKQFGLDQQILQQMVDEQAALSEARRQGITVTDDEVANRIMTMPGLQENGRFIGEQRYRQLLRMQNPPMSTDEFEDKIRKSLVVEKLRDAVTGWITVPASEVEQEYRRRNEKVTVAVVAIPADKFRSEVTVSDPDITSWYNAHKEQYRVGEKRKIRYLFVDVDALRSRVAVTPREVERYYAENSELYSTPEQVRASHILFKTEGKDDAAVKAKAEEVLKEARAGADFAELAKKYSEDEATAKKGGDLDYFTKGRMVPEFDEVAFSLQPGQISDLVKTQYGYHIIKVTDKKPGTTKTLDQVRQQITDQLAFQKAQTRAGDLATSLENQIQKPSDLDKAAAAQGLRVQETGFFLRDEPIMGLGPSPEASAEAFNLAEGQVSPAVRVSRGYVFMTVTGTQAPYIPKLADVRDKVREDIVKEKAKELAQQKATAIAAALKSAPDFEKAAKAAGYDVKTTDLIARGQAFPEIGVSPQVDKVAFSLPVNSVSDPIPTDAGTAIVKVLEKKDVTPAELAAAKDQLQDELLNDRRNRFFSAYMLKAKQGMKISVNREALQRVAG